MTAAVGFVRLRAGGEEEGDDGDVAAARRGVERGPVCLRSGEIRTGRVSGWAPSRDRGIGGSGRGLRAATNLVALVHERATGVGGEEEFDEVGLACGRGVGERRGG